MARKAPPPLATTDPRGDGIMQTVTARGATARTFLIHMFRRGLDDNRYVVERYKSTFDGEIIRWPCKGKSKTGKQPGQVMSLGAVQGIRPERDKIIVCTGSRTRLFVLATSLGGVESLEGTIPRRSPVGIVMYGRPRCCKGETDLKRR